MPLNPEKDGWHWIQESDLDPECAFWRAQPWFGDKQGRWKTTGTEDDFAPYEVSTWRYLGPCLTPDEATALQKRVEELGGALITAQNMLSEMGISSAEKCQMAYDYLREANAALERGKDE